MKRLLYFFLAMAFNATAYSQYLQELPEFPEDSLKKLSPEGIESIPVTTAYESELSFTTLYVPFSFEAPAFNPDHFLKTIRNSTLNYLSRENLTAGQINNHAYFSRGLPFLHSGTVFHQAAYKLNDKIHVGGNSFGAKSIFSAPLPLNGRDQWDVRGASMFMQYKVNKNFKIETRISVTGNQHHP